MTSLAVIFILLLVLFLNDHASLNSVTAYSLMEDLQTELRGSGLNKDQIELNPKDHSTIVITMPGESLVFQPNRHELKPEGEEFLRKQMPRLAQILCAARYRNSVEALIVEGHSDNTPYRGATLEESQSMNFKLSQDRSMEVVSKTLTYLSSQPTERSCLLEKLSATGRGEQDLEATADKSRRVVLKVRINPMLAPDLADSLNAKPEIAPPLPPPPSPAVVKIQSLLDELQGSRMSLKRDVSEQELNEYLTFALRRTPRPGINSIRLKIFPHNYISIFTVIDFDALARSSPAPVAALLHPVLHGSQLVWIDCRFRVASGHVTFSIEKAFYKDRAVPTSIVRKVIQVLAGLQPEGYDTEKPVPLPFGLHSVQSAERSLTVSR